LPGPCGDGNALAQSAPVPATVVIVPAALTRRTTRLFVSAMRKPPSPVDATAVGPLIVAEVAGPLSPVYPAVPFPATVVITPAGETLRTRLLFPSAMSTLPSGIAATSVGPLTRATMAWKLSPGGK